MMLHQIWIGGALPERFQRWSENLQWMHPGWHHKLWSYEDLAAEGLTNWQLIEDASQWVEPHREGQFQADIARYELITRYGGIYLDVDCEPLRPLDGLMGPESWAGWEIEGEYVGTSVIGGEPGGEFWQHCTTAISYLDVRQKRDEGEMTGPKFVTAMSERSGGLTLYPESYFYPYRHAHLDGRARPYPPESFVAHHWNRRRTEESKW